MTSLRNLSINEGVSYVDQQLYQQNVLDDIHHRKHDLVINDIIDWDKNNVFKIGPVIEPEKLPIHGLLIGPTIKLWSNR